MHHPRICSQIAFSCKCHALEQLWFGEQPLYFKLMVVFTPWLVVLSSNQRAVTVLVCV